MLHSLRTTFREDLHQLPRQQRAQLIEQHLAALSSHRRVNVACVHKLHLTDESPCIHLSNTGKPLHHHDQVPCLHVAHLEGDTVLVKEE